jgi:hypothetical protein
MFCSECLLCFSPFGAKLALEERLTRRVAPHMSCEVFVSIISSTLTVFAKQSCSYTWANFVTSSVSSYILFYATGCNYVIFVMFQRDIFLSFCAIYRILLVRESAERPLTVLFLSTLLFQFFSAAGFLLNYILLTLVIFSFSTTIFSAVPFLLNRVVPTTLFSL